MYLLHIFCQEHSVFDSNGKLMGNFKIRQIVPINNKNLRKRKPEVLRYRKTKDQYYNPALIDKHDNNSSDSDTESDSEPGPERGPGTSPEPSPGLDTNPGPKPRFDRYPKPDLESSTIPHSELGIEPVSGIDPEASDLEREEFKEQLDDRLKFPDSHPSYHSITNDFPMARIRDPRQHLSVKDLNDSDYLYPNYGVSNESESRILVNNIYKIKYQDSFDLKAQTDATQKIFTYTKDTAPEFHALRENDEINRNNNQQGFAPEHTWPTFGREEIKNKSTEIESENFDLEKMFFKWGGG